MNLKKIMALILSMIMIASAFTTVASAADYVTAGTKGADGVSDAYKSGVFYDRFSKITLTGDGRLDAVAIALSQVGYKEGNSMSEFHGMNAGSGNYTEFNWNMGDFGSGYGGSSYPWCASFVSFALLQAKTHNYNKYNDICRNHTNDGNYIWREIGCQKWREQLEKYGYVKNSKAYGGNYTPQTGDLIFFGDSEAHSSHIGIVVYCDGTNVYTVEGNTSEGGYSSNGNGVYFKSYSVSNTRILDYGVLPYKTNANAFKPDYTGKVETTGIYINTNYANTGKSIQMYRDADCTKTAVAVGTNEMIEIVEFVSENVAKVNYYRTNTVNFTYTTASGYMKLDSEARFVQAVSYGKTYEDFQNPPAETETTAPVTTEKPPEAPTEAPTTEAPTEAPTTEAPTTEAPTEAPTTEAPTTEAPTEAPTTEPTTEAPVTEPDVSNTFVDIMSGNKYVAHDILNYVVNDSLKATDSKTFALDYSDKLGISGWAGFDQYIVNVGYYFDGNKDQVKLNAAFLGKASDDAIAMGGSLANAFNISFKVSDLLPGEHTVTFVLKLQDGTIVIIDTLSFTTTDNSANEGAGDTTNTPTEEVTTVAAEKGCGSTIGGISAIVIALASVVAFLEKKKRK